MGRKIRCFDYVNHPYDRVRKALSEDAPLVFQAATKAAAARAESVASELRVNIAGIEVGTDIAISVKVREERARKIASPPVTRLQLEWQAAQSPRLFPLMKAHLSIYPLTATETQLDFDGLYEPPLGVLGNVLNTLVGHRLAEASVHRFVSEVAAYLRETLTSPNPNRNL
jgi:hypothetical protein